MFDLNAPKTARWLIAGIVSLATAQEVQWHASTWGTSRAAISGAEAWVEEIARRTDGKFVTQLQYGEELSKSCNNLDNIQIGAFQVTNYCAGLRSFWPMSCWG